MTTWRLKPGAEQKVRAGHPWVMSKDIQSFPKNHAPGDPVELQDHQGKFLARGYGNEESMIVFRALTFDSAEKNPLKREELLKKVMDCWKFRAQMGMNLSARIVFSECDYLPGLIVDRYVLAGETQQQVFAVQVLTAGMNKALPDLEKFFENLVGLSIEEDLSSISWEKTAVVLRNDVASRDLEGLREEPARFVKSIRGADFTQAEILLQGTPGVVSMFCDLFQGQKTGFFLDQTANIATLCHFLLKDPSIGKLAPVQILDLCCYVGHWSTQIAATLRSRGIQVQTTLVDVSARALEYARRNAEAQGAKTVVIQQDVMKDFRTESGRGTHQFDIVIADPPAFVKAKKDIPTGLHAYLKLNAKAFQYAKPGSYVVSCSCSGLVTETDFRGAIAKSMRRTGANTRMIARGGPAPDHPGRLSFPDGHYLKMFLHQVGEFAPTRESEVVPETLED